LALIFITNILSGIALPLVYALGIGLLASIAPCALTSNIAAFAYVSGKLSSPRRTVMAGFSYLAGRALAYGAMGLIILAMGTAIIDSTDSFRDYGTLVLGVILIIAGAIVLDKLKLIFHSAAVSFRDILISSQMAACLARSDWA